MEEKKLTDEEIVKAKKGLERLYVKGRFCESVVYNVIQTFYSFQRERAEQKAEIERLTEENDLKQAQVGLLTEQVEYCKMCADNFLADYQKAQKQVDDLKERLHWIWAIGADYDGMDGSIKGLKDLIDEMVEFTQTDDVQALQSKLTEQVVKDTAREICLKIIKGQPEPIKEKWLEFFKKDYGVEVE